MSQKVRGFPGLLDLILGISRVVNKSIIIISWSNLAVVLLFVNVILWVDHLDDSCFSRAVF